MAALNSCFSSVDGILFDRNQTTLILFPEAKAGAYAVPDSVTNIASDAFANCTGLTSITIPDGVTRIEDGAFSGCRSLSTVVIGRNLASFGWDVFSGCVSLTAVYFKGDAPAIDFGGWPPSSHTLDKTSAIVYYVIGTSGWEETYNGRLTIPWSLTRGDVDGNGEVDRDDLAVIVAGRNTTALGPEDPRDLDKDGEITVLDARILVTLFSVPAGFTRVASSPQGVILEWNDAGGALKLQSTADLQSGPWQDVGGLQSSTNAVVGVTADQMFFRLDLPE